MRGVISLHVVNTLAFVLGGIAEWMLVSFSPAKKDRGKKRVELL